jgi:hypothetical protein
LLAVGATMAACLTSNEELGETRERRELGEAISRPK